MSTNITRAKYEAALCARTRELRESHRFTQQDVADLLDVTKEQYRKYETRSSMPAFYLVRFALLMHVDLHYLLTGSKESGPRKRKAKAAPEITPPEPRQATVSAAKTPAKRGRPRRQ